MLLTLLMNLDLAGGTVASVSAPGASPITITGGGGSYNEYRDTQKQDDEKKYIDRLLQDDDIFFAAIQSFLNARSKLF